MTKIVIMSAVQPYKKKMLNTTDSFKKILKEAELHLKETGIKMNQKPLCRDEDVDLRAVYLEPKKFTRGRKNFMKRLIENKKNIRKFLNRTKKKKKKKKKRKKKN